MKTWQYLHSNTWNFPPAWTGTGAAPAEASVKDLTAIFVQDGREGLKHAKRIEMGTWPSAGLRTRVSEVSWKKMLDQLGEL